MTEVVPAVPEPTQVVLPYSGEVVRLDDPAACVRAHHEMQQLEAQLRQAKRLLTAAIVAESQRQGTKTLRYPGATVRVRDRTEIVWDLEVLDRLRDLGLPEERWNELVQETVTHKVNANVAKQIAGANEEYAQVIKRARDDVEKDPTIEVSR